MLNVHGPETAPRGPISVSTKLIRKEACRPNYTIREVRLPQEGSDRRRTKPRRQGRNLTHVALQGLSFETAKTRRLSERRRSSRFLLSEEMELSAGQRREEGTERGTEQRKGTEQREGTVSELTTQDGRMMRLLEKINTCWVS